MKMAFKLIALFALLAAAQVCTGFFLPVTDNKFLKNHGVQNYFLTF
jgi:hypothetical protein